MYAEDKGSSAQAKDTAFQGKSMCCILVKSKASNICEC
jgi:hypothetical protein